MSGASKLVDLVVVDTDARLWHTPAGDAYVSLTVNGHLEHHAIESRSFREWLSRTAWTSSNAVSSAQVVAEACATLGGMARYEGPTRDAFLRLGEHEGRLYLDLGDPEWRSVVIGPMGWSVESSCPIPFIRFRGSRPLHEPVAGGAIDDLRELIRVDDDTFRLFAGALLGAYSAGPFPIAGFSGEAGSGKTTGARFFKNLTDPQIAELRAEPRREEDLMVAASSSRVLVYDNVSHIEPWLSDALCRLSTGGAITRRALYTNSDEHCIEATRPVVLTSIVPVITRGDLLNRAIPIEFPVLEDRDRIESAELWRIFTRIAPGVLGAIFDAVSRGLARRLDRPPAGLPRLADWGVWVHRCEGAWGWSNAILPAFREVQRSAVEESVAGDPVAVAVRAVPRPWSGTSAALLKRIEPPGRVPRGWPESPRGLSAALKRLAPMLRQVGVEVIQGGRHGHARERLVRLEDFHPGQPSASSAPSVGPNLLAGSADDPADGRPSTTVRTGSAVNGPESGRAADAAGADGCPAPLAFEGDDHARAY